MAAKKDTKPPFTLEVAGALVQVRVLVRNLDGQIADSLSASMTIMAADLGKHQLTDIAKEAEKQLTEQILNPTPAKA